MNNKKTQFPGNGAKNLMRVVSRTKFTIFIFLYQPINFSKAANKGRTHEELWTIYYSKQFKRISEMGDFDWDKQETRKYF